MTHQKCGDCSFPLNAQPTPLFLCCTLPPRTPAHRGSVFVGGQVWTAVIPPNSFFFLFSFFWNRAVLFGTVNLLIWAPVYISVPATTHVYSGMSTRGRARFKVNAATLPPLLKNTTIIGGFSESSKCLISTWRGEKFSCWFSFLHNPVHINLPLLLFLLPLARCDLPLLIDCTAGQKNWGHPLRNPSLLMLAGKIAEKMSYVKANGSLGRQFPLFLKCKDVAMILFETIKKKNN